MALESSAPASLTSFVNDWRPWRVQINARQEKVRDSEPHTQGNA
jgi:hypothetical protein